MNTNKEQINLEQLFDQIDRAAANQEHVTLKGVIEATGHRSFGPLLLLAGLVILAPIIAAVIPAMELIPFSANLAGSALTIFGLSLIARDGLMALLALLFTATAVGTVIFSLL